MASDQEVEGSSPSGRTIKKQNPMTVYNILFPFLILVALGVAVFILVRHLGDVPTLPEEHVKEEKKRWWQIFLGKGEGFLRILRTLVLKIDNKLNDSIKNVREKKNDIGKSLQNYTRRKGTEREELENQRANISPEEHPDKTNVLTEIETPVDRPEAIMPSLKKVEEDLPTERIEPSNVERLGEEIPRGESRTVTAADKKVKKPIRFKFSFGKDKIPVQEIVKKTFTAEELKNEKREYWRKKESMLIQSIVREPKNVNLFLQLGRLYCNQKNWEDAKNAFYEVLKLDKMNIKAKEELKRIEKNEDRD